MKDNVMKVISIEYPTPLKNCNIRDDKIEFTHVLCIKKLEVLYEDDIR